MVRSRHSRMYSTHMVRRNEVVVNTSRSIISSKIQLDRDENVSEPKVEIKYEN